ncbi:MAG TPA: tetratricopeptide repeat protein [Pyrinomonadaceae bacterium]
MKLLIRSLIAALISSLCFGVAMAQTASQRNAEQLKAAQELVDTGKRSEAMAELNKMAASTDFDPAGFYNLGNAFARLGETDAAVAAYRHAIEQRKGSYSRAYNNLGVVLLRAGRWDEAYEAFMSALRLENFRYAEASYNLGRLYAARGQNDLAARAWRRALAVDPQHAAAAEALARGANDERIVVERPRVAESAAKPVSVNSAKPTTTRAAEYPRPAKTLILDQISFDYLQRARDASERGKLLDAVNNFQRLLNRQGGYFAPANLELSYALLSLKRYDEALTQLIAVTQRDGARYPVSYYHLARVYEMKGDLKNAESAFSQAVDANVPTNSQFLLDLSRVREKQGDFKGALEAMERYASVVQQQGQKPAWCDERLAQLRAKAQ